MNAQTLPSDSEDDDEEQAPQWLVLVNPEGQHALWPLARPVPEGWHEAGPEGTRADCLAWIDAHWTDLRPASARAAAH